MPRTPLEIGTYGKIRYSAVSGGWRARAKFRDYDGRVRDVERTGKTQGKAAQRLRAAIKEWTGSTMGELTGETRLSELAKLWLEGIEDDVARGEKSPSTLDAYRSILARHVMPGLGELRIREATVARIDRFLGTLQRNVGASSAKTARTVLSGMLGLATRYDVIEMNPTREARRISSGVTRKPRALDERERVEWLRQLEQNDKAVRWDLPDLSRFMMATGVRIGEALGVFWQDVDFDVRTVDIAHTVVRVKGQGLLRKAKPKTEKSERLLPLPSWAVQLLRERYRTAWEGGRSLDSPVFPSTDGGLRDPSNVLRVLREIRGCDEFLWVTSHTFRKTTATALDDADVPTRLIADHLGHARPSMTQDTYLGRSTVNPATAAALEGLFDNPSTGKGGDKVGN
ncbi:site-specific integrase [Saccharomonospora piscinae]|uniref:Site-specific integrase n=1 Tax=Saccharomonospora piscinae TaxID=687388 RepID=A0A1V9A7B4_SACPI|nr:site-specific integrase [Saccharomonospora piscinae]OQO93027.1 site-specific integrase [Saccharomonospora piscinae]